MSSWEPDRDRSRDWLDTLLGIVVVVVVAMANGGCLTTNPAAFASPTSEELAVMSRGDDFGWTQGSRSIDEQDFYHVAGDAGAVATIRQRRRVLVGDQLAWQAVGLASISGIVVGGGVMAGGIVWTSESGPVGLLALLPGVGLLMGSVIAVPLAYVYADDAAGMMSAPVLSRSRATATARRYNQRLEADRADRPRRRQRRPRLPPGKRTRRA